MIFSTWSADGAIDPLIVRLALRMKFTSLKDLDIYLRANNINQTQPDDVHSFARLALIDRELATSAAIRAEASQVGIAFVLEDIELKLGGPIENYDLKQITAAFEAKAASA